MGPGRCRRSASSSSTGARRGCRSTAICASAAPATAPRRHSSTSGSAFTPTATGSGSPTAALGSPTNPRSYRPGMLDPGAGDAPGAAPRHRRRANRGALVLEDQGDEGRRRQLQAA